MKKLSPGFIKRMSDHLQEHRQKFYEVRQYKTAFRLRSFAGHVSYKNYLTGPIKIAHLTDQHFGRVTPMRLQKEAIDLALSQNPDIVVLTGDFVCHSELYLEDLTEAIKKINCPKFAVLGNHDHWTNAEAVKKALLKSGTELLLNASTIIKIRNDYLQLVGIDDAYTKNQDLGKATKNMKDNIATLGLSHIPEQADFFWQKNVPLVLSGHTHGGQITIAGLHEFILGRIYKHKYIHGLYNSEKNIIPMGQVYVSAGVGSAVMPLRMGEKGKREVAIFELGK